MTAERKNETQPEKIFRTKTCRPFRDSSSRPCRFPPRHHLPTRGCPAASPPDLCWREPPWPSAEPPPAFA